MPQARYGTTGHEDLRWTSPANHNWRTVIESVEQQVTVTLTPHQQMLWTHGIPTEVFVGTDKEGIKYFRKVFPLKRHGSNDYAFLALFQARQKLLVWGVDLHDLDDHE